MKVRFTRTAQLESEGRNQGPIFEEGKTYEMEPDFAQRWIRRGVAELAEKVEPNYREVRGRAAKDDADGGAEQSQAAAAKHEKPAGAVGAADARVKSGHPAPHPDQSGSKGEADKGEPKAPLRKAGE